MRNGIASGRLAEVLTTIRSKVAKYRGDRSFNEQNTKASLIVPVLQALGWDTSDPDEVNSEYKPKPKYNPVDYALLLQRTPCLLIEAKALRENLDDDKLTAQVLTYASVAGVQWVVLTNGDEYRIYNASAPVPIEQKLFRTVTLSAGDVAGLESTLALLSKQNLQDKKIARLWESHFVDRQVHRAIEDLFNPAEPSKAIVHAIGNRLGGKLRDSQIRASLRRARFVMDFPAEPETMTSPSIPARGSRRGSPKESPRSGPSDGANDKGDVSLVALIREGLLRAPIRIFASYRGKECSATVEADGTVTFEGESFGSLSLAGGRARTPMFKGRKRGKYPATNGWTFWRVVDPVTKQPMLLDALRDRFLERQKAEANRFGKAPA